MQQSKVAKKTITSTKSPVILVVDGQATAGIQVIGTYSGTLQFEGSLDGLNWSSILFKVPSTGAESYYTTSTGIFVGSVAGLNYIRVRASALVSGTPVVTIVTSLAGSYGLRGDTQMDASGNTKVTQATAAMKSIDGVEARPEGSTYSNISASAVVRTGTGILVGMYVNSTSSGTIKFWDNTAASGTVINNTITPAIGYHPLGNASFSTGLYATIANTLDVTLYFIPTP